MRSDAEQLLLSNTIGLPHACRLKKEQVQKMTKLFEKKEALPVDQSECDRDDNARRVAVYEIMLARERNLWEPKGEAIRWAVTAGPNIDIQAALSNKFRSKEQSMIALPSHELQSSLVC